jgi:DNA-binding response OmpR family regulator
VDVWLRAADLRRSDNRQPELSFRLDAARRSLVLPEGKAVPLTSLEARLVELFLGNPGIVLDSGAIIRRVWDEYSVGDNVLLKNLIYRIRRKIEPDPREPRYIQTTFGGYIFQPDHADGTC